ncbi:putative integral membrane protein DUF2269 [Pseudonocardia sediminis]|uniref:Putative integral membrane protein DUF2269 n=1 Tax=Pseudonocardia sediminis TaxID=1397368 RepID=A0A4Q7UVW4_PSEST|nr:DUF2269 family protein [Pseudonocardia sediminis]RZT86072.1 putative integral membrane protein DUF2269 [Pseudonocardia sediminis]
MARALVGKKTRQLLVFVHVAVSVGWMGAGAANVVLALTAGYSPDPVLRLACYQLIDRIDWWLVIPLAFATLVSGVVVSVASPWGLSRYWWVLTKLVLTVAVIVYSTFLIGVWVEESIAAVAAGAPESPVAGQLAYGAGLNIVAFLFMTWASVAKPWGRTPWGRERRTRRAAGTRPAAAGAAR